MREGRQECRREHDDCQMQQNAVFSREKIWGIVLYRRNSCELSRYRRVDPLVSPIFLSVLVLIAFYTHFNLDLVQYNTKLLRKAAARLRAADAAKRAA